MLEKNEQKEAYTAAVDYTKPGGVLSSSTAAMLYKMLRYGLAPVGIPLRNV